MKNLTSGIWLIFRGLNFSRNADIGQISHLWMDTNYYNELPYSPDAVAGIAKPYELYSHFWYRETLDEKQMRHMIGKILSTVGVVPDKVEPQGAKMLNDRGEQIGIWYSAWELPTITFLADSKFRMSQPRFQIPDSNKESFAS